MYSHSMIEVVSAVIIRHGRVLLTQRDPERSDYGWLWETPGGKVEEGESRANAVVREVLEELDLDVLATESWLVVELPDVPKPVRVTFFKIEVGDQHPVANEAVGIGWFGPEVLWHLDLAPANCAVRLDLAALLSAHPVGTSPKRVMGRHITDGDHRVGYVGDHVRFAWGHEVRFRRPDGSKGIWNGGDAEFERLWV